MQASVVAAARFAEPGTWKQARAEAAPRPNLTEDQRSLLFCPRSQRVLGARRLTVDRVVQSLHAESAAIVLQVPLQRMDGVQKDGALASRLRFRRLAAGLVYSLHVVLFASGGGGGGIWADVSPQWRRKAVVAEVHGDTRHAAEDATALCLEAWGPEGVQRAAFCSDGRRGR